MTRRDEPIYEKIGNEIINELITIGLSFLIVIFGVNYFNFKYAWFGIIQTIGEQSGISQTEFSNELGIMFSTLGNMFPFKYLFGEYNVTQAIFVGIGILAVGLVLKMLLRTTREKFISDIGRDIYVPAIIGFVSLTTLQIILGITAKEAFTQQLDSSLFIWNTYGQMFIVGINALIIGSVVRLIAKKQHSAKIKGIGNAVLNGAYISLGYYLVLRIFSLQPILDSSAGSFFKIFLISGDITAYIILFCIFMFTAGLELNKYGKHLRKEKIKKLHPRHLRPKFHHKIPNKPYPIRNH